MDAKISKTNEGSSSSSSSSQDSDSSESESAFGLNKKTAQSKASKPKGKKAGGRPEAPPPSGTPAAPANEKTQEKEAAVSASVHSSSGGAPSMPTPSALDLASAVATPLSSRAEPKGLPALLEKAGTALAQLKEVSAVAMLNQQLKQKDIDSRVQKAVDLVTKLEGRNAESATELANSLNKEVNRVSQENELVRSVQASPSVFLVESKDALLNMMNNLSADQHFPFLTDIAKRLVEAGLCPVT